MTGVVGVVGVVGSFGVVGEVVTVVPSDVVPDEEVLLDGGVPPSVCCREWGWHGCRPGCYLQVAIVRRHCVRASWRAIDALLPIISIAAPTFTSERSRVIDDLHPIPPEFESAVSVTAKHDLDVHLILVAPHNGVRVRINAVLRTVGAACDDDVICSPNMATSNRREEAESIWPITVHGGSICRSRL